ncbi:MAG TPA: energy transducer TonB [Archangium sp.]|uniref:energy transducer TonB n=1 Tax=Archangium sp. TaxID=1872627 RepID=UPI002E37731B|nr:energy transducer TonB [Archangium sp.]HEX5751193.1 energy transducer TonB [Archangium sp.]
MLCQYQLLPEPVLSRLPESYRPSELIRQEDLDFLRRHPSYLPEMDLDRPGLQAALSRFVECSVEREVDDGNGQAAGSVRYTRPRWEAASLRTSPILNPSSPTRRLIALNQWIHRHPETTTTWQTVLFERTPTGWRADFQRPEQEALHPRQIRSCSDPSRPVARLFGPGMSMPRLLSGSWPTYTRDAYEARVQGLLIAQCRITTEGETKDCCISKPLPHLEWAVLRQLSGLHFEPATDGGEPIEVEYVFRLRFSLPR